MGLRPSQKMVKSNILRWDTVDLEYLVVDESCSWPVSRRYQYPAPRINTLNLKIVLLLLKQS